MKNRIFSILMILLMLVSLSVTAHALDLPDVTRDDCTINVVLWDKKKDKGIVGAELVCYRVGYVNHDSDYNYHFYDIRTNDQIPDSALQSSDAADVYEYYAKAGYYSGEEYPEHFEKEGVYYFKNLPVGLYVVVQKKAAKGYSNMKPFLVSIPYMEDGEYVYEVTANVKTELWKEPEPTPPTSPPSSSVPPTTKPPKLPQTGQLSWPIPWLASSGMVMFAFGWWLYFSRRKDSYEG